MTSITRRSGLRPLLAAGSEYFVPDDSGRLVEVCLYVGANGAVTARAKDDPGVDQALGPQRTIMDRLAQQSVDQS